MFSIQRIARTISGVCLIGLIISFLLTGLAWHNSTPIFINDDKHFNETLMQLLKPRFIGSLGHTEVSDFIFDELQHLGFDALRDELFDVMNFTNILGIMNTEATKYLMLCCHYDSKRIKGMDNYVGATDAAVSCAILLNMAKTLRSYFHKEFASHKDIGLLLVFFDGHESSMDVVQDSNSLNGSRRFAEVETIPLYTIEVVIAFNLIGAPDHIYMSHFEETNELHKKMAKIEVELGKTGQLHKCHKLFHAITDYDSDIEDDHYPFLEEGVPVMHVVPHTYPDKWHTNDDNLQNLHWPTIYNMNAIVTRFVYDYISEYHKVDIIENMTGSME